MRTTRVIGVTATMLGVLVVAGCGGGSGDNAASSSSTSAPSSTPRAPSPGTTTGVSSTPITSASPSSSGTAAGAPGVPEAARQHTKAGAKAFAEYFYDRVNVLYRNPSKDAIAGLYLKSCATCRDFEDDASAMYKRKQHFIDDQLTYKTMRVDAVAEDYHVFIRLTQNPARMVDSSGNVVGKTPTPVTNSVALLNWRFGGGWIVEDLQHE